MKIGIYGGTYNPPHHGHLNLALEIMERASLDEIWWIPVASHPFQEKADLLPAEHRVEMVRLAIEEIPQFTLLEIETQRVGTSFTVDTLRQIKKDFPEHDFHLLLGDDAIAHFHLWKEPEEILRLAPPLVGGRKGEVLSLSAQLSPISQKKILEGFVSIPLMQISSTNIRHRLKEGLYCGHLLPGKVLDYISSYGLYS